ncbi:MAG: glycosyltransferase [Ignavibacteriales bacterium]
MRIVMFYHSLVSDWNHGNAHFLRGIVAELIDRGHELKVYEPAEGWSLQHLIEEYGSEPVEEFHKYYPGLYSFKYSPDTIDLDRELDGAQLVIVHEWNEHQLVSRIGQHRKLNTGYRLLFHDTHHRSLTDPESMGSYDLSEYDGLLAYGEVIRNIYLKNGWIQRAWTWHEAADVRMFHPFEDVIKQGDLIWIGNWGDEERTKELHEYLLQPVKSLGLKARVYGVRYPDEAIKDLNGSGIEFKGWLANFKVPRAFAEFRVTIHVPRRPYVASLRGIPTIRPFEALACGIPLVSSPWEDTEGLFTIGKDFLMARNGNEMKRLLKDVLNDSSLAGDLSRHGRETILRRHTCSHRVKELMQIYKELSITGIIDKDSLNNPSEVNANRNEG